ncbi:MAG TPA: TonB family protein [Cyclobacteriaceae bacterium]|nr:TonB family protein [Cyclobacteriaceae bacterium]
MNGVLNYLWEGSMCLLLLYAFYSFILSKLTFFNWNRLFLLLSLVVVLTIPLVTFQITTFQETNPFPESLPFVFPESNSASNPASASISAPSIGQIIVWMYFAGLGFSLLRLLAGLFHILRQIRTSRKILYQGNTLLIHPDCKPSSFFHYIFLPEYLPDSQDQALIIAHEKIHSRLFHTFDCLIFQVFRCVFWFHPIIKLVENSLYALHEYQVDQEITRSHSKAEYSELLVRLTWTGGGKLVNNFNQFQIKNRIMMMAKTKSQSKEKFKFLFTLPLLGLLIVLFSCEYREEASPIAMPMQVYDVVEDMPRPMGGLEGWNKYLRNSLVYTTEAKEKGISGTVYLTFVVDTEGSVKDVEIFKGIDPDLDQEALKVVENSPKWTPGTQDGQKVNVKMRLPIRFQIDKSSSKPDSTSTRLDGDDADGKYGSLDVAARYADGIWSGVVRDRNGKGLSGATIVLADASLGTVSDINGQFSLKTSESENIYVSFPGYKSTKIN